MKRRTFVSGVMSAGVLSTATTISALSAASNKTISPTAHPIGGIGQHQQRFARALKPGMTVGVVAPSSNAFEDDDIHFALDIVSSLGFKPKPGRHLFKRYGYLAGTDAQRAADLNAMFVDDEVDAIFCARGGYGAMRILPMLDYTAIAANPKVLLGYSDITALISAIDRHAGSSHFTAPSRPSNTRLTLISLSRTPYFYISGASRSVPRLPSRLDPAGLSAKSVTNHCDWKRRGPSSGRQSFADQCAHGNTLRAKVRWGDPCLGRRG